jgi:hypothetical protein
MCSIRDVRALKQREAITMDRLNLSAGHDNESLAANHRVFSALMHSCKLLIYDDNVRTCKAYIVFIDLKRLGPASVPVSVPSCDDFRQVCQVCLQLEIPGALFVQSCRA